MGVYTFTQDNLIIPLCSGQKTVTANIELDSFHMKGYDQATVMLLFDSLLSGDSGVLVIESGSADSGDVSQDVTFHYRLSCATVTSVSSDVLGADATASTLTLTAATYQAKMLVLEVHADELYKSGETVYDWLTVDIDGATATGNLNAAFAILSKPRYAKAVMRTALA